MWLTYCTFAVQCFLQCSVKVDSNVFFLYSHFLFRQIRSESQTPKSVSTYKSSRWWDSFSGRGDEKVTPISSNHVAWFSLLYQDYEWLIIGRIASYTFCWTLPHYYAMHGFFWSKISQSLFIFQAFTDLRVKGEIWLWFLDVDSWREAGMPPWPTRSLMTAESDAGSPWLTRSLMTQGPPSESMSNEQSQSQ